MINTISVTDLKQNISKVIKKVHEGEKNLVILQRSKAAAVLVDPKFYEILEGALEDMIDLKAIDDRKNEPASSSDEVSKKLQNA